MTETPDDLLEPEAPETEPSPADLEDDRGADEGRGLEEHIGLTPPD